ncbi:MAG: START domain-containing protein [Halioglobus sp.]|nr:START domain-containing protein [Halioglobus sp.]
MEDSPVMALLPRNWYHILLAAAYLLSAALSQASAATESADDTDWQLQERDKQISVYTREVEGSPYLAVKAIALIDAPMARVAQFLGDGDGCSQWRAMCKSSRVIDRPAQQERRVYLVLDFPWPVSDRDVVMHSATDIDPESNTATVRLQSDSAQYPEGEYVRAKSTGRYILRPVGETQVEFTYIMHTDPGGGLSAGMVNARLTTTTLEDIRRLVGNWRRR